MQFFNHYSAAIIGGLIFVLVFCGVRRRRSWFVLVGVVAGYGGAWLIFRPVAKPAGQIPGKPMLLEVQSPCCLGCVAMKPSVNRLEAELHDKLIVSRVDIQSDEGRRLAKRYDIEFTPTFILLDAAGEEGRRATGRLDAATVRRIVDEQH